MGDLQAVNDISYFQAILWCFIPIGTLVLAELLLGGGFNDDDDDDFGGGKGIRVMEQVPVPVPSGA
tara:strand:+ start:101 stop:298 length:198 start_codon:yes stop_codon:yes gene_type:complete